MKITNRRALLVLSCVVVGAASGALAQDWPQWLGLNRDGKATGFTAPKTWPKQFTQKWKTTVGLGDAGPAVVGDKLYVFSREGNSEVLRCLNAADGKEIWQDKYDVAAVSGADSAHSGPRGTPAVAGGKVFTLGVFGDVSCLDTAGKLLWRKKDFPGALPRFHTGASPIVVDGLCIVPLGSEANGGIVAYDVANGDQKWKWTGDGAAYGSPALMTVGGTKCVATVMAKTISVVAVADGKLLWQAPFAVTGMAYNATTPIVNGDILIYCGQGRGAKAVKLAKQGDTFTATDLWSTSENSVQFNTPVLKDGFLYGLSANSDLFCLNAKDGKTAWTAPVTAGGASGAPAPAGRAGGMGGGMGGGGGRRGGGMGGGMGSTRGYGSLVDAGSVLMALTPAMELVVYPADPKAFTEVARVKVADKAVYGFPVLVGNRLFIKDQDSVTLWSIE